MEHRAKIYHSPVLWGKLWSEVWWITDMKKGGVLHPEYTCPKTGLPILDVLRSKHPKPCPLSAHSLEAYGGKPPEMLLVDITDVTVATVARDCRCR